MAIRVTVWNENFHEQTDADVARNYPQGIHGCIAGFLGRADMETQTATLDMPEHGLTDEVLDNTDVLVWWGHMKHGDVSDEVVDKVHRRVLNGMGFIALHSSHASKIFKKLVGTSGSLRWREAGEKEILWVVDPSHPIVDGIGNRIVVPHEEMYGEQFGIPSPDELVFISWFQGGEVFRSGCCWHRGKGKVFYFRVGHEAFANYEIPDVQRVITNAVKWAAPIQFPPSELGQIKEPIVPFVVEEGEGLNLLTAKKK